MLTSTYIHAPGVGSTTERSLWEQGATTWPSFLERSAMLTLPQRCRATLAETVEASQRHYGERHIGYFAQTLPKREHWRAFTDFRERIGYLDIETDGGYDADSITVIGLFDGFDTHVYLKGRDLAQFAIDCRNYTGFVTFFGGGFDIPFLKRRFPALESVFADRLHIDLCPLLKRLGHRGGLKKIERELGISRVPEAEGLDGMDAVRLWHLYRRGGRDADEALRLLLAYNREDVENMQRLMEYALPKLRDDAGWSADAPIR